MIPRFRIWFAFLGGALAWTVHFMGSYAIGETACKMDRSDSVFLGINLMQILLSVLTLICAGVAIAAIKTSRSEQLSNEVPFRGDPSNARFIASTGGLTNLIFLLVILAEALPLAMLAVCG